MKSYHADRVHAVAKVLAFLLAIAGIVSGIYLFVLGDRISRGGNVLIVPGLLAMVAGCFSAWIAYALIAGFAALIDINHETNERLKDLQLASKADAGKASQASGKPSAGTGSTYKQLKGGGPDAMTICQHCNRQQPLKNGYCTACKQKLDPDNRAIQRVKPASQPGSSTPEDVVAQALPGNTPGFIVCSRCNTKQKADRVVCYNCGAKLVFGEAQG